MIVFAVIVWAELAALALLLWNVFIRAVLMLDGDFDTLCQWHEE